VYNIYDALAGNPVQGAAFDRAVFGNLFDGNPQ
jgi:hypothetical protein